MPLNKHICFKPLVICILSAIMTVVSFNAAFAQDRNKLEKQKAKLEKEIASMNAILKETKKTKRMY